MVPLSLPCVVAVYPLVCRCRVLVPLSSSLPCVVPVCWCRVSFPCVGAVCRSCVVAVCRCRVSVPCAGAQFSRLEAMEVLLKAGAHPDIESVSTSSTALIQAIKIKNMDAVELLLKYKANPAMVRRGVAVRRGGAGVAAWWCGAAWRGVVWCGVAWCGAAAWCGGVVV